MAAETASPLPSKITSIKTLPESPGLTSIPATHTFPLDLHGQVTSFLEGSIPVIDYSLLISGTPGQRSKIVHELGRASQDWGFFMVINHGVPQKLLSSILAGCRGFFDLEEEEKQEFKGNHVLDPIRSGTSFNVSVEKVFYWRDFLKVFVHPVFYSPTIPDGCRGFFDLEEEEKQEFKLTPLEITSKRRAAYARQHRGALMMFY